MEELRKQLRIPAISTLRKRIMEFEAWKARNIVQNEARNWAGPATRSIEKGNVTEIHKDWAQDSFNQLSHTLRNAEDPYLVKNIIKLLVR